MLKKRGNLFSDNTYFQPVTLHDSAKVIFNFSNHALSVYKKSCFAKV